MKRIEVVILVNDPSFEEALNVAHRALDYIHESFVYDGAPVVHTGIITSTQED